MESVIGNRKSEIGNPPLLVAIMGPTASGKTAVAEAIAERLNAQLINADAFQAYRGMDIGTAKPQNKAAYLLLDIKSPKENYGVGEFCALAVDNLKKLYANGQAAVVVGGTGLYIRALLEQYDSMLPDPPVELRNRLHERLRAPEGLKSLIEELKKIDPEAAARVDLNNPVRVTRALERALDKRPAQHNELPSFRTVKIGLLASSETLNHRIEDRTRQMVQNGWVQEVVGLLANGYSPADPGFRAIGYREIASFLEQRTDLEDAIATTIAETRRYAKRQRTWLRSEPRLVELDPMDPDIVDAAMKAIQTVML